MENKLWQKVYETHENCFGLVVLFLFVSMFKTRPDIADNFLYLTDVYKGYSVMIIPFPIIEISIIQELISCYSSFILI